VATVIAFEAVSGNARLNSSIGFPAISARRAASRGCSRVGTGGVLVDGGILDLGIAGAEPWNGESAEQLE
jgi:hypothetical protein